MKQRLLCLLLLLAVLTGCSSSQMVVPGDTASTPKPPASVTPPGDETTETTEPEQVLPSEDGTCLLYTSLRYADSAVHRYD